MEVNPYKLNIIILGLIIKITIITRASRLIRNFFIF